MKISAREFAGFLIGILFPTVIVLGMWFLPLKRSGELVITDGQWVSYDENHWAIISGKVQNRTDHRVAESVIVFDTFARNGEEIKMAGQELPPIEIGEEIPFRVVADDGRIAKVTLRSLEEESQ